MSDLRVIKLGGRTQADERLPQVLAQLWASTNGSLVLVHGGGDQISRLQGQRGDTPRFVGGRRVTTESDLEVVRMALSGLANKQLVSALVAEGVSAVGVSGEDAALLRAEPLDTEVFGFAGRPVEVNVAFIRMLLAGSYLPVISPVAAHVQRAPAQAMNVNGDDAASAISSALEAEELFFMADVPGVMDKSGSLIPNLGRKDALQLIENGTAAGGMAAKLEAGMRALEGGVSRVRIGDLSALADISAGTVLLDV